MIDHRHRLHPGRGTTVLLRVTEIEVTRAVTGTEEAEDIVQVTGKLDTGDPLLKGDGVWTVDQ